MKACYLVPYVNQWLSSCSTARSRLAAIVCERGSLLRARQERMKGLQQVRIQSARVKSQLWEDIGC